MSRHSRNESSATKRNAMRGSVVMLPKTMKTVEDTVLSLYMNTKQPLTVIEIRDECKLSKTVIRTALDDSTKITQTSRYVAIMSKQYPRHVHQHRSVAAWYPTRGWLVDIINQTRLELPHYKYDQKYRR